MVRGQHEHRARKKPDSPNSSSAQIFRCPDQRARVSNAFAGFWWELAWGKARDGTNPRSPPRLTLEPPCGSCWRSSLARPRRRLVPPADAAPSFRKTEDERAACRDGEARKLRHNSSSRMEVTGRGTTQTTNVSIAHADCGAMMSGTWAVTIWTGRNRHFGSGEASRSGRTCFPCLPSSHRRYSGTVREASPSEFIRHLFSTVVAFFPRLRRADTGQFTLSDGAKHAHSLNGHMLLRNTREAMTRIVRATSGCDFVPTRFPILFNEELQIIEPAFEYLIEVATLRGRSASPSTVETYAEHLLDWFDALEQTGIDWILVTTATLASYRRRHQDHPSPATGRNYAPATINARIRTVCRFYRWAAENGWIEATPFPTEFRRNRHAGTAFFGNTRKRGRPSERNPLVLTERRTRKRGLSGREVHRLLETLGEPYRTMAVWAILTGMRRMELCGLTLAQIPDAMMLRERDSELIEIRLVTTKGGHPRSVYAPVKLIDRTNRYIQGPRAQATKAEARRGAPSKHLFLGPRGRPVMPNGASKKFRKGFKQAGVYGNLHCLRHTFAVRMLETLTKQQRAGESINMLMVLRDLLGHASVASTETYLSSLEILPDTIEPVLEYLYGATIGEEPAN